MNKQFKRVISLALALLMTLAFLPATTMAAETEPVKANIVAGSLEGPWATPSTPANAYDGNTSTRWNPAGTDFNSGEAILFTLDQYYDLSKIVITLGGRYFYFDISGSTDGITYTPIAQVTADNYSQYYLTDYVCTIDGLSAQQVKYVKVSFTGASVANNYWVNFYEIEIYGNAAQLDSATVVKAGITAGTAGGGWGKAQADTVGNFYDGDALTKWNPNATDFASNEHVVFTLDDYYDLSSIEITVTSRYHYFTLFGSSDGETYTQLADVTAENYNEYYESQYVCVVDELSAQQVKYVKLLYTGNSQTSSVNLFGNFNELAIYGTISEEEPTEPPTEPVDPSTVPLSVIGHTITGTWKQDHAEDTSVGPQKVYDGDLNTKWNPQATGANFASNEGIVLEFDWAYDLNKLQITFGNRYHYFNVYGSADGVSYRTIAQVTDNTNFDENYVWTLENPNAENVKFLKIRFTSIPDSTFVNLFEVAAYGTVSGQGVQEDISVISGALLGSAWGAKSDISKAYDGYTGSSYRWNPAVGAMDGTYGAIFTLEKATVPTEITMHFASRYFYVKVFTSLDNQTYTQIADVNADNYKEYYKTDYVCTIDNIEASTAKYIKVMFTGASVANNNWVNFDEIQVKGLVPSENVAFKVSGAFSSNMVLQRNKEIPVWGFGKAGETVTGVFAGQSVTTTVADDNTWKLSFPAQSANAVGQTMTVSCGDRQFTFDNILIGDVYMINGQSNAELQTYRTVAHLDAEAQEACKEQFRYDNNIRIFLQKKADVVNNSYLWGEELSNVLNPDYHWQIAAQDDAFWNFSALGMYFAKTLRESLSEDIPIGMIQTAAGGAYLNELMSMELAQELGYGNASHTVTAGGYYNTLIHPFAGYPIAGMLFFQGESNNYATAYTYAEDLSAYINDLRARWGMDFAFYNVQLSSYGQKQIDEGNWPYLPVVRDQQYQALSSIENYYLTVSMDVGYNGEVDNNGLVDNYHPKDKKTLGERVANQALAVYYNQLEVGEDTFSPVPSEIAWNTDGIIISFANAETLALATGDTLVGFQCVINEDAVDVTAQIINGNQVKLDVDATTVSQIRYGMSILGYPENANLSNGSGLPAPAFTVDNPGEFTTNKIVAKSAQLSDTGWKSIGVSATLPYHSYDRNTATYWNPEVSNFSNQPSITYTLNKAAQLDSISLLFMNRQEYFILYTSTDGSTFTQAAIVTAENYSADSYLCTITDLNLTGVVAVKLAFTGSSDNGKWIGLYEISFNDVQEPEEPETTEPAEPTEPVEVQATIIAGAVGGTWNTNNTKDDSGNLFKAYDGNTGTKWNPTAKNFASNEHAVFTLNKAYDLTKIVITVASRHHFFTLYGSTDGVLYTQLADINAYNYTEYYLTDYVCTVNDLSLENVKYIKVMVNGSPLGIENCFVNFQEIQIYGFASAAVTDAVSVAGWSLTLGDDIGVNFYLNGADTADAQAIVTVAGASTTYDLASLTANENGYYAISTHLAAAQMTETVTLTLQKDGQTISSKSYTVYDYAQYVLDDVHNLFDDETENLVRQMLNYGAKAQTYFGYNAPAVKEYYLLDAGKTAVEAPEQAMSVTGAVENLTFYGASLVYESKIAVRFYFAGSISGCTLTANGVECKVEEKNGLYYVQIADILPQQLDTQITVTVTDGSGNVLNAAYSPLNYIARMNEKGSEALKPLIQALYNYYLAAQAYVA